MRSWLLQYWKLLAGAVALIWPAKDAILSILDWRGRYDAAIQTYHDLGGWPAVIGLILSPPPWFPMLAALVGVGMILWHFKIRGIMAQTLNQDKDAKNGSTNALPRPESIVKENLPGLSLHTVLRLPAPSGSSRFPIMDWKTNRNAVAAFYISASNRFTFAVTDTYGETYSLELPLGTDGIPINRRFYLMAEIGISGRSTEIRIGVDGKVLAERTLPFSVDLGDRQWRRPHFNFDPLKRDPSMNNGIVMDEIGYWSFSLTERSWAELKRDYYQKKFDFQIA
ncbi:hypothetical protein IYW40_20660 [Methylocystis sp. H4A]|uniref:hypothetical protein n=1 Tax=Methylocystis sp. H4A TaxID=2785788 RepID=UPI0018C2B321|nr:hypothetical protein [Methylocystis sp. H4A]MBG0803880.1 hypothetical protein [Methylocystis sp. H4A]